MEFVLYCERDNDYYVEGRDTTAWTKSIDEATVYRAEAVSYSPNRLEVTPALPSTFADGKWKDAVRMLPIRRQVV